MASRHCHQVQTVDFSAFLSGSKEDRTAFIRNFGDSIKDHGFVVVRNHGIDRMLIEKCYSTMAKFFSLAPEIKNKFVVPHGGGQRGFTSFGTEHAKNESRPDLKEFWHVGREPTKFSGNGESYPPNVWPDSDLPGFRDCFEKLYGAMDQLAASLLDTMSQYLLLPDGSLSSMAKNGNSILRLLHYPPLRSEDFVSGSVRAAAHEDINLITLLCSATDSGLEILNRSGEWVAIESHPGEIVVDSGDMLSRVTNGFVPSTTHRVVNPRGGKNEVRYSMPFFVHPFSQCDLSVLKAFTSPTRPPLFPPCSADEFLKERLAEIGLATKKPKGTGPN